MTSHYNRKIDYLIYWLGSGNEDDCSRLERLKNNQISVVAFTERALLEESVKKEKPDLLVISDFSDIQTNLEIGIAIKSCGENESITFMMITELLDKETKEYFYQSGGNELILEPASLIEIFFRIKHLKFVFDKNNSAGIQIEEASQMALLAMENSSDLGSTINFVKAATRCQGYQALAQCILNAVKTYSDSAIVEMVGAESLYYFCSGGDVDPDLKKLMQQNKNDNRIVHFDNAIQMNQINLVILAEGLPVDDVGRMGRIADNLAILADTADRFVSELLLQEQAVATEKAKRRFISTISHELNTPMNAIQGFSKMFASRNQDEVIGKKGVVALSSIYSNAEKMKSIIETLIEITSENSQADLLSKDDIQVSSLIFHLKNSCTEAAEKKNLLLKLPENCSIQFKGDQKHIRKMLFHLIDNAIKFTEDGEVELAVLQREDSRMGDVVEFCVKDSGIGISEENLPGLFNKLGQLDISHNRKRYGAGLGLYYVQSFTKQLNGKIKVSSDLGKGSIFTLTLPSNVVQILDDAELF